MRNEIFIAVGILLMILVMVLILFVLQKIFLEIKKIQVTNRLDIQQQEIMNEKNTNKKLQSYVDDVFFVVTKDFLILDNQERIFLREIVYLIRHETYTTVNTPNETKRSPVLFSVLQENLPPNFVQCNAYQIVNKDFIIKVTEDRIILPTENLILEPDYIEFFKS